MKCGNTSCVKMGLRPCSGCLKEGYCGPECQKKDWKLHKLLCSFMKNGDKLLPFDEVVSVISKLKKQAELKEGAESKIRLLEYCLSFAEHQYGSRTAGNAYRERKDGSRISNWNADIFALEQLCFNLGNIYRPLTNKIDNEAARIESFQKALYYYEKSLSLLEPWRIQIDLERSCPIKSLHELDNIDINHIYYKLSYSEIYSSEVHNRLNNYDEASKHCEIAFSHASHVTCKEEREVILYEILIRKGNNLTSQTKYNEAISVYEELYNMVIEIHDLDHPLVLTAANLMIDCLNSMGRCKEAEGFARISYECLTRPVDNESEEVADAARSLADNIDAVLRSGGDGDIVEAEMLSRKALRIMTGIHGSNHFVTSSVKIELSNILGHSSNSNDERKALLEQTLPSFIKLQGNNGDFVAKVNNGLGNVHNDIANTLPPGPARNEQHHIALKYFEESLRIATKIYGPTHPYTIELESSLSSLK